MTQKSDDSASAETPDGKVKRKRATASKKIRKRARRTAPAPQDTCFVLMPFKEPFETYYAAILEPAVVSCDLVPQRGDSLFRPSPIMGDIWRMIQDAKLIVAELTERNANVFYELGLAHAIGKPVVMVAESIEDVPFDLQPLRVLLYDKNDPAWGKKLRASLSASIQETLADTGSAVPPMFRRIVKSSAPVESEMASRLQSLEREFASIRSATSARSRHDSRLRSPNELFHRLRQTRSRIGRIDLLRRAIEAGIPLKLVEDVARASMPPSMALSILREAVRLVSAM